MIPGQLAAIDGQTIAALLQNGVPESVTIDYKETLPSDNDEGRREFLADVSAFANTFGGDIVYGISEARDSEGRTTGLPEAVVGVSGLSDSVLLALQSRIRDGLDPRLSGVDLRIVPCEQTQVLVVRVAQSWTMPHMVTFKNYSKFFARKGASKYQMNVDDLRTAFTRLDTLRTQIDRFRDERISRLVSDSNLIAPPWLALHVMPASGAMGARLDQESLTSFIGKILPVAQGGSWTWNFDGPIVVAGPPPTPMHGYCQLFRDGSIESVVGGIADLPKAEPALPFDAIEVWIIEASPVPFGHRTGSDIAAFLGDANSRWREGVLRAWQISATTADRSIHPETARGPVARQATGRFETPAHLRCNVAERWS
jgi:hypothetical protein